jgi:NADH:ubiquinone oxidoreductase subunit 2 (subunit N)
MLNSAIGAYYYLRVTVVMYFNAPRQATAVHIVILATTEQRRCV